MKLKKIMIALVAAFALAIGGTAVSAPPAQAVTSGSWAVYLVAPPSNQNWNGWHCGPEWDVPGAPGQDAFWSCVYVNANGGWQAATFFYTGNGLQSLNGISATTRSAISTNPGVWTDEKTCTGTGDVGHHATFACLGPSHPVVHNVSVQSASYLLQDQGILHPTMIWSPTTNVP